MDELCPTGAGALIGQYQVFERARGDGTVAIIDLDGAGAFRLDQIVFPANNSPETAFIQIRDVLRDRRLFTAPVQCSLFSPLQGAYARITRPYWFEAGTQIEVTFDGTAPDTPVQLHGFRERAPDVATPRGNEEFFIYAAKLPSNYEATHNIEPPRNGVFRIAADSDFVCEQIVAAKYLYANYEPGITIQLIDTVRQRPLFTQPIDLQALHGPAGACFRLPEPHLIRANSEVVLQVFEGGVQTPDAGAEVYLVGYRRYHGKPALIIPRPRQMPFGGYVMGGSAGGAGYRSGYRR